MTTDFTDETGRVVARSILTGVETGQPPADRTAEESTAGEPAGDRS